MKRKSEDDLRMSSAEFDKMMGKALQAPPPKEEPKRKRKPATKKRKKAPPKR